MPVRLRASERGSRRRTVTAWLVSHKTGAAAKVEVLKLVEPISPNDLRT